MKKLMLLLMVGIGLSAFTDASAQAGAGKGAKATTRGARSAATGFPLAYNQPLHNTADNNPEMKPLVVVAYCNATSNPKDIEAWVGSNNPLSIQDMVATTSGTGRQTITFVVPYDWWFQFNVIQQSPTVGGMPPGGSCKVTGWWTY